MFLSDRNISLTTQGDLRPRKRPRLLRDGGGLLAEGPFPRLLFPDARNTSSGLSIGILLFNRIRLLIYIATIINPPWICSTLPRTSFG